MVDPNELPMVEYTTDQMTEGRLKDPINLIFVGALANPDLVLDIVRDSLGLGHDKGVSDQYFSEPANPRVTHRQDFNQTNHFFSGFWSRVHTRVYGAFTPHRLFGPFIAAPIHIDHWVGCEPIVNDAAESYDGGRKWATDRLWRKYDVAVLPLRPFDDILQCDGSETPTDGQYAVVATKNLLKVMGQIVLTANEP